MTAPEAFNTQENITTPEREKALETFKVLCDDVSQTLFEGIELTYNVENGFVFHNIEHTKRGVEIVDKVNERNIKYGLIDEAGAVRARTAYSGHDAVLVPTAQKDGTFKRLEGVSEKASILQFQALVNQKFGEELKRIKAQQEAGEFPEELDVEQYIVELESEQALLNQTAEEGITGTIPRVKFESTPIEKIEEIEAHLREGLADRLHAHFLNSFPDDTDFTLNIEQDIDLVTASVESITIGEGDLSQMGYVAGEKSYEFGDGELHETHRYILENVDRLKAGEELTKAELERMRVETIKMIDLQPGFTYWQHRRKVSYNLELARRAVAKNPELDRDEVFRDYFSVTPYSEQVIIDSLDRCDAIRGRYPSLFKDPITFAPNDLETLNAFSGENAKSDVEALIALIEETRLPRPGAVESVTV